MAKNFVSKGDVMTLTAPYVLVSGAGALIGTIFGVALGPIANGAVGDFGVTGIWDIAKLSAQAWAEGAIIYWDNAAKLCTTVSTSNTRIGVAAAAALNPSATGRVRLNAVGAPSGVA